MSALPSLRQLSYLVKLSEKLNFTQAAEVSFVGLAGCVAIPGAAGAVTSTVQTIWVSSLTRGALAATFLSWRTTTLWLPSARPLNDSVYVGAEPDTGQVVVFEPSTSSQEPLSILHSSVYTVDVALSLGVRLSTGAAVRRFVGLDGMFVTSTEAGAVASIVQ